MRCGVRGKRCVYVVSNFVAKIEPPASVRSGGWGGSGDLKPITCGCRPIANARVAGRWEVTSVFRQRDQEGALTGDRPVLVLLLDHCGGYCFLFSRSTAVHYCSIIAPPLHIPGAVLAVEPKGGRRGCYCVRVINVAPHSPLEKPGSRRPERPTGRP